MVRPRTVLVWSCLTVLPALPVAAQFRFALERKQHLPELWRARAIAAGDLDGDHDQDLVVGTETGQDRLLLNDGAGVFRDAAAGRMPAGPGATLNVVLLDVDRDGDLDVFLSKTQAQSRLLINDGSGRFTDESATRLPLLVSWGPAVAAADVDRDGDLDLFLALLQPTLWLNDGSGHFTDGTAGRLPAVDCSAESAVASDIDRDGDADLWFHHLGALHLLVNDGTGVFQDETAQRVNMHGYTGHEQLLALAVDVDRNGYPDLLVGRSEGYSQLLFNDGTGSFWDATFPRLTQRTEEATAVAAADLDRDGDPEFLLGNQNLPTRVFTNAGPGFFLDRPDGPLADASGWCAGIVCADVDGDGDVDVVLVGPEQPGQLLLNDGTGNLVDATAMPVPLHFGSTSGVAVGDVDGDGDLDLALGRSNTSWAYYYPPLRDLLLLNDGAGGFTDGSARLPAHSQGTGLVRFLDVDGDGDLDLVSSGRYEFRLWINDRGVFRDETALRLPPGPPLISDFAAGDIDGDGDIDLVVATYLSFDYRVLVNNGSGVFTNETSRRGLFALQNTRAVLLYDLDHDGDLDVVLGGESRVWLYRNIGGSFQATSSYLPANSSIGGMLVADVNQDSHPDLILSGPPRLFLNDGTGHMTDATSRLPALDPFLRGVTGGDLDQDGDVDLIFSGSDGSLLPLRNDGTGRFTHVTGSGLEAMASRQVGNVVLADLDRDQALDVVVGGWGMDGVLRNLIGQVRTPLLLRSGHDARIEVHAGAQAGRWTFAVPLLAAARLPQPIALPGIGWLSLDPAAIVASGVLAFAPDPERAVQLMPIPADPGLLGVEIGFQALLLATSGIPALRLAPAVSDRVVRH